MSIWSVIGSRCLPSSWEPRVGEVVDLLLSRGHRICSGGAVGADLAVLRSLVRHGASACQGSSVFLPGDLSLAPPSCLPWLSRFAALGGEIVEGSASARSSRREVRGFLFVPEIQYPDFAPLSLDIPDIFIHFISIDRVFHPTGLRKERERESLYRCH